MNNDFGSWLWLLTVFGGFVVLGTGLFYGGSMWQKRRRDAATRAAADAATRRLYHRDPRDGGPRDRGRTSR